MVTNTMTPVEIFNILMKDKEKIEHWIQKYEPKVIKSFTKQLNFPKYQIIDFEHQISKNKYLFYYGLQNSKSKLEHRTILVVCDDNEKRYIEYFSPAIEDLLSRENYMTAYTSHFFKRYKERVLKNENLTTQEVIGSFFSRSTKINLLNINNNIIKDYDEKHGKYTFAAITSEGLCLGERGTIISKQNSNKSKYNDVVATLFKTFISKDMLSEEQNNALKKESINYYNRYNSLLTRIS